MSGFCLVGVLAFLVGEAIGVPVRRGGVLVKPRRAIPLATRVCAGLVAREREGLVARESVGLTSFLGGVRLILSLRLKGLPSRLTGLELPSRLTGLRLPSRLTGLRLPFLKLPFLVGLRLPRLAELTLPLRLVGLRLPNRLVGLRLPLRTGLPFALDRVIVKSSSSLPPNPNSASESDSGNGEREGTVEKDMAPGERDMAAGDAPRLIPGDAPVPRDMAPGDMEWSLGAGVNISKSTPLCLVGECSMSRLNPIRRGVGVTGVISGLTAIIVMPSTLRGLAELVEPLELLRRIDAGAGEPLRSIDAGAGEPLRSIDAGEPLRTIDAGEPNALPRYILDAGDLSKFEPGEYKRLSDELGLWGDLPGDGVRVSGREGDGVRVSAREGDGVRRLADREGVRRLVERDGACGSTLGNGVGGATGESLGVGASTSTSGWRDMLSLGRGVPSLLAAGVLAAGVLPPLSSVLIPLVLLSNGVLAPLSSANAAGSGKRPVNVLTDPESFR